MSTPEEDIITLSTGFMADGLSEVAFSHSARTDKKHVLLSLYKLHGSDLANRRFMDLRVKREVEILQSLLRIQITARKAKAHLPVIPSVHFVGQKLQKKAGMVPLLFHCFLKSVLQRIENSR